MTKKTILTTAEKSQNSTSAPDIKTKNRCLLFSNTLVQLWIFLKFKDNLSNKGDARCLFLHRISPLTSIDELI